MVGGYSITKGYYNNEAKTNEVYKVRLHKVQNIIAIEVEFSLDFLSL